MEKIRIAFANDDGENLINKHFGDAGQYSIYEINPSSAVFIKNIDNAVDIEEHGHADPNKARGISGLFKDENVQVLVSKQFGANINKMKKKYVCILMSEKSIKESIKIIQKNYKSVVWEWEKGENRHYLNFKLNKNNF